MRHLLVQIATLPGPMACVHRVDGTSRLVLELEMFGFAHASRYILLKPSIGMARLVDDAFMADVGRRSSRYGKVLAFGSDLFLDADGAGIRIELP